MSIRSKRKRIVALLLAAVILTGGIPAAAANRSNPTRAPQAVDAISPSQPSADVPESLRGVWIATVYNVDFPGAGGGVAAQKASLVKQLDAAKAAGLNAVFFQVRPTADALYKSSIFPWSEYLTGKQGSAPAEDFDALAYIIEQGKQRGIAVHAWVNPYRITVGSASSPNHDVSKLSENHPARLQPELTVPYADGKLYFNPGEPASRDLVVRGVMEIVRNYDVAGIHFDDYFYPYPYTQSNGKAAPFDDALAFAKYGGGYDDVAEWRRANTYALVKEVHDSIKAVKPSVQFGVSPFGVWANKSSNANGSDTNGGVQSFSDQFADTRGWVKDGIIDYICPQLYWAIGFKNADYSTLLDWWCDVVRGTSCKLYIGHALYKAGDTGEGANWMNPEQIPNQIKLNRQKGGLVSGSIMYNATALLKNPLGTVDLIGKLFTGDSGGAVTPPATNESVRSLVIGYPSNGVSGSYEKIYIIGSADPRFPVYLDGQLVENRSASGHFSVYVTLKTGENTFTFSHNGEDKLFKATRTSSGSSGYVMRTPEVASISPGSEVVYAPGEVVMLSCVAPAGVDVTVTLDGKSIAMKAGDTKTSDAINTATYTASYTVPDKGKVGKVSLGSPTFAFSYGGKNYSKQSSATVYAYVRDPSLVGTIKTGEAIMRTGASSSAERISPMARGASDNIVWEQGEYYKFAYGYWTHKSNVETSHTTIGTCNISAMSGINTGSETLIRFTMERFPSYEVDYGDNAFVLTFSNTNGRQPFTIVDTNPLFSDISYRQDGTKAVYTFTYKAKGGFYGYNAGYSDGKVVFGFRNPPVQESELRPLAGMTVVVDAGHGGSDEGAFGPMGKSGMNEKDLNLRVAMLVEQELRALGANVVMTRTTDIYVSLDDRADLIRKTVPAVSVSIHHNSVDLASNVANVAGVLTLYSNNFSKSFANVMQDSMLNTLTGRKSHGVRQQGLAVCRIEEAPSILVELGFICNPNEYELLSSEDYMRKEAAGIASGVRKYLTGK